jgi:uroporphyrinogen-III synthase
VSITGRTILLTREPERSSAFIEEAERQGARVIAFPMITARPPQSWEECDRALAEIDTFGAMAFTSANGVRGFRNRCAVKGIAGERLARLKCYAVGSRTAAALAEWGMHVEAMPERFSADALGSLLRHQPHGGGRMLLPQGNLAAPDLAAAVMQAGIEAVTVEVYRTVPAVPDNAVEIWHRFDEGTIDVVTFASPSAVAAFARLYPAERLGPLDRRAPIAVIGQTTHQAVREQCWTAAIIAAESTMAGLLHAITTYFDR